MMKCYDCMEESKDTDATSVCIICGKGLCAEHTKVLELPVSVGMPPNVKRLPKGFPRHMCNYCLENTIVDGFD